MKIAIDGPAGAGKSTVARLTAAKLGFTYVDTGAMYRALTFSALQNGISLDNEEQLANLLHTHTIQLKPSAAGQSVWLSGQDITQEIRDPAISRKVSIVAKYPQVRTIMTAMQRKMAEGGQVVMDGRDIGTHVLPDAEVKIFLTASIEERAARRFKELLEKGHQANLEELKAEIALRDKLDSEREVAPLRCAKDAAVIDTTGMAIGQVVDRIIEIYEFANQAQGR